VKREKDTGIYYPIQGTVIRGTAKEIMLKVDNSDFGHMLLIAQNHKIDMKEVLYYPLRPKP
jgi:hypothetical protein